jgi:hypothetical protein
MNYSSLPDYPTTASDPPQDEDAEGIDWDALLVRLVLLFVVVPLAALLLYHRDIGVLCGRIAGWWDRFCGG